MSEASFTTPRGNLSWTRERVPRAMTTVAKAAIAAGGMSLFTGSAPIVLLGMAGVFGGLPLALVAYVMALSRTLRCGLRP